MILGMTPSTSSIVMDLSLQLMGNMNLIQKIISVEINMVILVDYQCFERAKTTVEEVKFHKAEQKFYISIISSVNFPVVAGGFALLAASGATQAVVGAAAPFLSTSFVGGAASLLGNIIYNTRCPKNKQVKSFKVGISDN